MQVSYNLKYRKSNFSNRVLIEKEGEIVIYDKGLRLKGKGAGDKGEFISFSDVKEFYYKGDKLFFITFAKAKYTLSNAGTVFEEFLHAIYKARNEFLIDALFMKQGRLKYEFDGHFERFSKFSKPINKGRGKLRLYEGSLVIVPLDQDAFGLNFNFVNFHEFDEDYEYNLKIAMDDGQTIFLSRFGNDFEFFQEKVNELLGGMYETLVNGVLKESFPYFHAGTLLKMAYKMKGGKGVHKKDLMKIDPELAKLVDEFVFDNEDFKEKIQLLADEVDDYGIYYGIAKDPAVETSFIKWVMFTIPSKNIVSFTILPRWKKEGEGEIEEKFDHDTYFFRIIMEKGNPADKVEDKIREIDQSLVILDFAKDACYKDKRDLRHSPYQYAIRKLPFLRILRKSYVGKAASKDVKQWKDQVQTVFKNAALK